MLKQLSGSIILIIIFLAVMCYLIDHSDNADTRTAIENNNDRGSQESPIPQNTAIRFEEGRVTVSQLIRPANDMVAQMNTNNPRPSPGNEFVLIWLEVECATKFCLPSAIEFNLVDTQDREWADFNTLSITLDNAYTGIPGGDGNGLHGWRLFEVSQGSTIDLIKVEWSNARLYAVVP